jgi:hypothetical protein
MLTWLELDKQFRDLTQHVHARLDYQWGAAGTYYQLAGGLRGDTDRFTALVEIAGMKISELPVDALHADIMQAGAPEDRWYEALRHYSGAFEPGFIGTQQDADGTFRGQQTGDTHRFLDDRRANRSSRGSMDELRSRY